MGLRVLIQATPPSRASAGSWLAILVGGHGDLPRERARRGSGGRWRWLLRRKPARSAEQAAAKTATDAMSAKAAWMSRVIHVRSPLESVSVRSQAPASWP